ncbi:MAG: NAD(P)H-dependent oxidoreductase [Bacteroidales bacterium]|nr:NAD(P)H-dependent oxidoreductase [Bacteroidales bacterium]
MKIAIINGSPRGKNSNTRLLLEQFIAGLEKGNPAVEHDTFYLVNRHQTQDAIDCCLQGDVILMAFPLYTDAMPGIVKLFFEKLTLLKGKKIGYMLQSGFPEAIHCFYLEKYLEKFTRRLGASYLGTVSKGNVEGIQDRPAWMNKGLFSNFRRLGLHFAKTGELDEKIISKLKRPLRLPKISTFFFSLFASAEIFNYGWVQLLKAKGAYEVRHARPYQMKIGIA